VQQQQQAKAIVQGGSNKNVSSIADRAKALGERLAANQAKYTAAKENLDARSRITKPPPPPPTSCEANSAPRNRRCRSGNQMKVALKTMIDVYHPGTFQLGQATSQLRWRTCRSAGAGANERGTACCQPVEGDVRGGLERPAGVKRSRSSRREVKETTRKRIRTTPRR
jgi:hypothetical protein